MALFSIPALETQCCATRCSEPLAAHQKMRMSGSKGADMLGQSWTCFHTKSCVALIIHADTSTYIIYIYNIYLYIEYYAVYQTYYVCNHAFSVELVVATAASCWPKLFSFPMYLHFMIISHQSSGCHSAYDSQPCC